MMSMDFEEFLWAKGYSEAAINDMICHMETEKPFNNVEMNVYSRLFLDYYILGGMPAVVREYVSEGSFEGTLDIQRQLLEDYRGCIEWLRDAGIVNICYCLNFPELPLKGNYDESKYKLYFFDTGIFARFC